MYYLVPCISVTLCVECSIESDLFINFDVSNNAYFKIKDRIKKKNVLLKIINL